MPVTLAIQIEKESIQLARAQSSESGATLVELVHHAVPEESDALTEAASLLQSYKGSSNRTAAVFGWRHYSVRQRCLQLSSEGDIRAVIKHELADDLADDPESVVVPFQIIEERPEGTQVLAWAAAKQDVAQLLALLDSASLTADSVVPDAIGHVGLIQLLAPEVAAEPVIAISGDSGGMNITLMRNGLIWAHRRMLSANLAAENVDRPRQEIRRLMLSMPGFPEPAAVVSFGPPSADAPAAALAAELQCRHLKIDPPPQAGREQNWPLVAGVALALATQNEPALSFRQEEFEPKESARMVGLLAALALGLLGVCMIIGGFILMLQAQKHKTIERQYTQLAATAWKEHVDANVPVLSMLPVRLNQKIKEIKKTVETARGNTDEQPVYRYLVQALVAVPADVKYRIERISFKDNGAALMVMTTSENANRLSDLLNRSRHFTSVLQGDAGSEGEARYTLNLTYKPQNMAGRI